MNKQVQSIIRRLENTLSGDPWYGLPVYDILQKTDRGKVFIRPSAASHSMADLLYHLLTWAEFTLYRIRKETIEDINAFEQLNWREIDPQQHSWEEGLASLKQTFGEIITQLQQKDDEFLKETVDYRGYNFRFLLNGIIEHTIYHAGQIAYVQKLLDVNITYK